MVGAFFMPGEICFLCPFLRKEVSTVANRIMGITKDSMLEKFFARPMPVADYQKLMPIPSAPGPVWQLILADNGS